MDSSSTSDLRLIGARRVEEERGAGPTGSRPFPFPAHQTGRALFEHPAFRQNSPSAHGRFDHEKTQYTKFPEHNSVRVMLAEGRTLTSDVLLKKERRGD